MVVAEATNDVDSEKKEIITTTTRRMMTRNDDISLYVNEFKFENFLFVLRRVRRTLYIKILYIK